MILSKVVLTEVVNFFVRVFEALAREIGDKDEVISQDEIMDLKKGLLDGTFKLPGFDKERLNQFAPIVPSLEEC